MLSLDKMHQEREEVIQKSNLNFKKVERSLNRAINKRDFKVFSQAIFFDLDMLHKKYLMKSLLDRLKLVSQERFTYKVDPFEHIKHNESFNFILDSLKKQNKDLQECFTRREIVSPNGLNILLKRLEGKGRLRGVRYHICFNSQEGISLVKRAILESNLENPKHCVFLHPSPICQHVIPLFIEKRSDEKYQILMIDSLGYTDSEYTAMALNQVIKALKEAKVDEKDVEIYAYLGQARQKDKFNCWSFALDDLLQYAKDSSTIIELAKSNLKKIDHQQCNALRIAETQYEIFSFDRIPPNMMRLTQNLSYLREYDDRNGASLVQHLREQNKIIKLHPEATERNYSADMRADKFKRQLCKEIIFA